MDSGLVSVILPVFNRPSLLREAVASVLAQTYRRFEILVVDDGSTDETPAVIAALAASHPEIRPLRRENGGPGAARETGRLAARGEYIQYFDSDDLLLPHKFERQIAALQARPECGVAYGITQYHNADGTPVECTWKPANQVQSRMFPSFLMSRWWDTLTPLYRCSVTDAVGAWRPLRLEEDWEYDCRVASLGLPLAFVPEPVAIVREHAEGRLSRGAALDPLRLGDRAAAHLSIAASADRAGVARDAPEMQHFARALFLLARQCGAAGLTAESRSLLAAARERASSLDMRLYGALSRVIGNRAAGKLAIAADRFRR